MTPYDAYMAMMFKLAMEDESSMTLHEVARSMPRPVGEVLKRPEVRELVDPTRKPLYGVSRYVNEHKGDMGRAAANNILYGMLSNPRGNGPVSLTGASVGGVIDGMLFKPVVDAGIGLVGKGLRAVNGLKSES